MQTLEIFDKIISESELSKDQKKLWQDFAFGAPEISLIEIIGLVRKDQTVLSFLTDNLEKKIEALRQGKDWEKIIESEKQFMSK